MQCIYNVYFEYTIRSNEINIFIFILFYIIEGPMHLDARKTSILVVQTSLNLLFDMPYNVN